MTDGQNQNADDFKSEDEMTEEELTALHESEDFIANFQPEDTEDADKAAELLEKLASAKTTIAQKKHYREKFNELNEKSTPAPTGSTGPAAPADEKKTDEVKRVDPQVATDFRLDHPELSKEVAKKVIEHAAAYGNSPEEALKDPLMESFVKNANAQEDVDEASPAPGSPGSGEIAEKDWSNATSEEMDAERNKMMYPNG